MLTRFGARNISLAADHEDYDYDAAGNRILLRKRDGRRIAFAYDALNRLIAKTYPQGGARAVHYGYDLRNLQLFARFDSPSGEGVTNGYDGFGRLASSSTNMGGVTRALSYAYDAAGNRISITHPDGIWFGAWYDALGRQYYLHANNSLGLIYTYFAPHGAISAIGRPGIASWIGYDAVQRPSTLAHRAYTPAATDVAFSFGRNPAGQITSLTRDNDAYAWNGHYAANRAYVTNGLNQYSAAGTATFGYDLNGNLTSDGANSYVYDIENRLVSASGTHNAALAYDPLGRLYQVTGSAGATTFLYDGDALVAEYDGATLLRRHAHWQGADVLVATFDVANGAGLGTLRNLFADQQGSIIAEADGTGAVTAINRYDEYGIPAASNVGRFQYTGQAWLAELGMYYYKARIYSPTLGRFLQTDPIGYADQFNLYDYVGDDPVNRTDPDGQEGVFQWIGDSAKMVVHDLADLGGAVVRGDFEYAFGGMPPTLGGGAGGMLSGLGRTAARAEIGIAGQVARTRDVHRVLDPLAQTRRTTAVLETSRGRIVAGGGRDLTPAQRAALRPGEAAARGPGMHAEVTALRQAAASGARPNAISTSSLICPDCAAAIRASGGQLTSGRTAVWRRPWWRFWDR